LKPEGRKTAAHSASRENTEHTFFAEDRIEHMQAIILARDELAGVAARSESSPFLPQAWKSASAASTLRRSGKKVKTAIRGEPTKAVYGLRGGVARGYRGSVEEQRNVERRMPEYPCRNGIFRRFFTLWRYA
jgi:hypothetical protein